MCCENGFCFLSIDFCWLRASLGSQLPMLTFLLRPWFNSTSEKENYDRLNQGLWDTHQKWSSDNGRLFWSWTFLGYQLKYIEKVDWLTLIPRVIFEWSLCFPNGKGTTFYFGVKHEFRMKLISIRFQFRKITASITLSDLFVSLICIAMGFSEVVSLLKRHMVFNSTETFRNVITQRAHNSWGSSSAFRILIKLIISNQFG